MVLSNNGNCKLTKSFRSLKYSLLAYQSSAGNAVVQKKIYLFTTVTPFMVGLA